MVEEDYAKTDSTIFQRKQQGAPNTRFNKDKRFKAQWDDSSLFSPDEIEPYVTKTCYWFPVTMDDEDFLCADCRMAKSMDEIELSNKSLEFCINCSANCQDHYKRSAPTLGAQEIGFDACSKGKDCFCGVWNEPSGDPSGFSEMVSFRSGVIGRQQPAGVRRESPEVPLTHGGS